VTGGGAPPAQPGPAHARRAHGRLAQVHAAGTDGQSAVAHPALHDLRPLHARDALLGLAEQALGLVARAQLLGALAVDQPILIGGGLLGLEQVGVLARERLDLEPALVRPADPDLLGRTHGHRRLGRLARRELDLLRPEAELALVVGLDALEADPHGRVGLVLDRDLELDLAPARRALGLDLRVVLLERLDAEQQRLARRDRRLRLGVRDDLELPDPRLGLGRARRVEVDLHLLLVRAAGAERHEVHGVGEDRPPVVRESAH
jgi:hypothetical protein